MATRGEFNLGRIKYLLKNNFTSTTKNLTLQSIIKTLTLTLLTINPTLLIIPPINPVPPIMLPTTIP